MNLLDVNDIDPATGLVRLPDGEFWRIEERQGIYPHVDNPLRIRRLARRRGFLGIPVLSEYVDDQVVFHPDEGALHASQRAATDGNRERVAYAAARKGLDLVGDYPPNSLRSGSGGSS